VLLRAQGEAGVMIQAMEMRAVSSIGRLPFLESSNFQRDVLTGKDEELDNDDVFVLNPRYNERIFSPHTFMENYHNKLSF